MTWWLLLLLGCHFANDVFAEISFIHCLGPADLGGLDVVGFYRRSCIQDENFSKRTHAWNFEKSIIRRTTFIECGFEDTDDRQQKYAGSTWEHIRFEKCHFGPKNGGAGSVSRFTQASFHNVTFDSCVFHASAEVVFSSFYFSSVTFKNCRFLSKVSLSKGKITRLSIEQSGFAPYTPHSSWAGHASFSFSQIDMSTFTIAKPVGGVFRIQASTVADLSIEGGTPESLICHEKPQDDKPISLGATMNSSIFVDVGFHDGIYCGHGILNGVELHDVRVGRNMDLAHSKIQRMAILNLTSLSVDSKARFSLEESAIDGGRIKSIENITTTFKGAVFQKGIFFDGIELSKSSFVLTDAIFSQERINKECCTILCLMKRCKCDVALEPVTGCPKGNSSVNVNIHDSCFPADSTVSVVQRPSVHRDILMKDLRHGQLVTNVMGVDSSEVFFFGHRSNSQLALFIILQGHVIKEDTESDKFVLPISAGHVLPVFERGQIPASEVHIGDTLLTSNGETAKVTEISSRVQKGMYAPTTLSGKLSVNGIQVSCYTDSLPPSVAHVSLAPLRALYRSSRYGREVLQRIDFLDEKSGAWVVTWLRRLLHS